MSVSAIVATAASVSLSVPSALADSSRERFPLVEVVSAMNHKCLDVLGFNPDNGARVGVWDCWGGANQTWYWDGGQIRSFMNHKCLDVLGFNPDNGARVGMWDCWGGANQMWYRDGGQIRSSMNHKCLDLLRFNPHNGARVGMWDCRGGANQLWRQFQVHAAEAAPGSIR